MTWKKITYITDWYYLRNGMKFPLGFVNELVWVAKGLVKIKQFVNDIQYSTN